MLVVVVVVGQPGGTRTVVVVVLLVDVLLVDVVDVDVVVVGQTVGTRVVVGQMGTVVDDVVAVGGLPCGPVVGVVPGEPPPPPVCDPPNAGGVPTLPGVDGGRGSGLGAGVAGPGLGSAPSRLDS